MASGYSGFEREAIIAFSSELEKIALGEDLSLAERSLSGVDAVRPYLHRAAVTAVPGALLGTAIGHARGTQGYLPVAGSIIGAGIGAADMALENMSKRRQYRNLLSSYQAPIKSASLAEDARRTHVGGARPATEDSKGMASQQLQSAQAVGRFRNMASPKTIGVAGHTLKDTITP